MRETAPLHRLLPLLLLAALCSGCELQPEPTVQYDYDPYTGDAFPDRRPAVELPAAGAALITDSYSDTISLVDLGTGERFASVSVGRDPVGIDGPHHLAVDPSGGAVFTALSYPPIGASGPHASHGLSVQPGYAQKLSLRDFRILGQVRVDNNPGDIVLSDDHLRLVVSHFDLDKAIENQGDIEASRATLALIDPATLEGSSPPEPKRIIVCAAPHGVALSRPDAARAYVACYGEDSIAVVDLDAAAVLERVPVASGAEPGGTPDYGPYSAILSPDGKTLAIGNQVSKDVRFLDVEAMTIDENRTLATLGVPFFPAWSPDGQTLYVTTQTPDELIVIDVTNGDAELARRTFAGGECERPHVAEVVDGALLLVCEGDKKQPGKMLTLDPITLDTATSTDVGVYPDALVRVGGTR